MLGKVKKIVTDKGFGFIRPEDGAQDIFFHVTDVAADMDFRKIKEGEAVKFDTIETSKGLKAVAVAYA